MDIEIKILTFFLKSKESGREFSSLITLDRYLVNVEKENEFIGSFLIKKIEEMEKLRLIHKKNINEYCITNKGLSFLSSH